MTLLFAAFLTVAAWLGNLIAGTEPPDDRPLWDSDHDRTDP